jgi:hypothetical protein
MPYPRWSWSAVLTGATQPSMTLKRRRQMQNGSRRHVEFPASRLPVALAAILLMVTILLLILIVLAPVVG